MNHRSLRILLGSLGLLSAIALAGVARADSFKYDGFPYKDVKISGFKDGGMAAIVGSAEKQYDLAKLESLNLVDSPKLNAAEDARKDPKKASALYLDAIKSINRKDIKLLAQARAISVFEADGKYLDAVTNFLDVYQAAPTAATWELHPQTLPAAGSTLLKDSALRITEKLPAFAKSTDATKNLKSLLLEIYTKANDPKAAALAKELNVGIAAVETPVASASTPQDVTPSVGAGDLSSVEGAVNAKKWDDAITQADALLATATGDAAIKLFQLKAQAYLGLGKQEDAALSLMRIALHYPNSPAAPTALLQTADIQKKLKQDVAANRLYKEIVDKYPNSPQALTAKKLITG
jgi:hypothetical protein